MTHLVFPSAGDETWNGDTSISRASENTVQIGNTGGTPDASGTLKVASLAVGTPGTTYFTSFGNGAIQTFDTSFNLKYQNVVGGVNVSSESELGWANSTNITTIDTSISRASANVVQIGNTGGTPDASGTLKCATLIEGATLTPASATTAGVTGQIAWQGTNGTTGQIFICTAGGSAGGAIWMAATLAKV
jgi:hypothetical protein